jgi:NitT/TauT family transport system substrate-binding protein
MESEKAINIVHFAQINARDGFFIAAREADVHFGWDKLCGKKLLADHFFQPLAMLKYGLHRQCIDFFRLYVIDAGDVAAIDAAFRNGIGDYVHLQGPAAQQLEQDGVGFVVAAVGDAVGPVAFSSLCASREWLASEMARSFMHAYQHALNFVISAPPDEIAARQYEAGLFPGIDRDVLANTIACYQKLGCWEPDPVISQVSYENLLDVFLFSGDITRRHNYDNAIVMPPGRV